MSKKNDIILTTTTAILAPCLSMSCAFVACYQPVSRCYKQSGEYVVSVKYSDDYNNDSYEKCSRSVFRVGDNEEYDVYYRILSSSSINSNAILYKRYANYQTYNSEDIFGKKIFYLSSDNELKLFSKVDSDSYIFIDITSGSHKVDESLLADNNFMQTYVDFDVTIGKVLHFSKNKEEKIGREMATN